MITFDYILDQYRSAAESKAQAGRQFEELMLAFLQTVPYYADIFSDVWLWNDFPLRAEFGERKQDTGIDIVCRTKDGQYWAVQCKFYGPNAYIDKAGVDSFLSTSSRSFRDENGTQCGFAHRLWISTTDKWSSNAEDSLKNQNPPCIRLNLTELREAPVDWGKIWEGLHGKEARLPKKEARPHQKEAIQATAQHFKTEDRGKLIMACGTGKTYTALQVLENQCGDSGLVLFLVPSIALLGQTLREWSAESKNVFTAVCVCSDPRISDTGKKRTREVEDSAEGSVIDLGRPATTDPETIAKQLAAARNAQGKGLTIVFSTYQSIDAVATAQAYLALKVGDEKARFDLVICDEAHRTTGFVRENEENPSAFVRVHEDPYLPAKKRLYMTATPRLFSDTSKAKATENNVDLFSMDDENLYGKEIYRLGFGEAVEKGLLTDYKVLVLTLQEDALPKSVWSVIKNLDSGVNLDDASKIVGCINALSKQVLGDNGIIQNTDPEPMRRAVAFCQNIKTSKLISDVLSSSSELYGGDDVSDELRSKLVQVESKHIDGTMNAPARDELMSWLKADAPEGECRILTNVRCLSEGVDVPTLDAVLFLSPRNSPVDVVQSVGRVMRLALGKKYGYIIIPVVIPAGMSPEQALDDNQRFKVVWTVLNALRAHDDRFNATINKIDLNKKKPNNILIARPVFSDDDRDGDFSGGDKDAVDEVVRQLELQFDSIQGQLYARLVQKVGDRLYWENWAKDVAQIAEKQFARISALVKNDGPHRTDFAQFLGELRANINPSITEEAAVEMLAQHLITRPVFDALFEGYSFTKHNPVSQAMQAMIDRLQDQEFERDYEPLRLFYDNVRRRVDGVDNAEGRQRIIIELYDKFFKTAFPKTVERLGIVYTPVEVVDYIIQSVDDLLRKEFGRSLGDENVHVIDPFTGTGTFIVRMIQSGLITPEDLRRKYATELHANEIVLLAYYIAAVNIESAYHDAAGGDYAPFAGICLTDTFQLAEEKDPQGVLFAEMLPRNSERVERQKKTPIQVIIGNPPYSIGQGSANDFAQNQSYPKLEKRIDVTYSDQSTAALKKSAYDSYIKAFRWATDRLDPDKGGIVAFVTNGGWLDGVAQDGFRKVIEREFAAIYVFNLRGNQRTSGELSRKEGGKIFDAGSRAPIAITLLIKKPNHSNKATIHYHDIGDYLNRQDKLSVLRKLKGLSQTEWTQIEPNDKGDWIAQRTDGFDSLLPMATSDSQTGFFIIKGPGVASARDSWVINFSRVKLIRNIQYMIDNYEIERKRYVSAISIDSNTDINNILINDSAKISWTRGLKSLLVNNAVLLYSDIALIKSCYRPYCRTFFYYDKPLIESPGLHIRFFPTPDAYNRVICVNGTGSRKEFAALVVNAVPDYQTMFNNQCFPLYYYVQRDATGTERPIKLGEPITGEQVRKDAISDYIHDKARKQYADETISKEDVFYYVYGLLHSPDYREAFADNLRVELPRIPLVERAEDFRAFMTAGRQLADLHVNYESVPPADGVHVFGAESGHFHVEKMRHPSKMQKDIVVYNSKIKITGIPAEAYEYVVNGRSPIEWVMERYQIKKDSASGIVNDPNDWAAECGNPRYILDLLLSVIRVSVETVAIVKGLPKLSF